MRTMVGFPLSGASVYSGFSEQRRESEAQQAQEACAAWQLAVSGFLLPVLSTCFMSVDEGGDSWQQEEKVAFQVKSFVVSVSLLSIPLATSVSRPGGEKSCTIYCW